MTRIAYPSYTLDEIAALHACGDPHCHAFPFDTEAELAEHMERGVHNYRVRNVTEPPEPVSHVVTLRKPPVRAARRRRGVFVSLAFPVVPFADYALSRR